MKDIIILNSKDRKLILKSLNMQFGIEELPKDLVYFCYMKRERVQVVNRAIFEMENIEKVRINALGMYFGTIMKDGFRPSLEALHMLKDQITKYVYEVDEATRNKWIEGQDLEIDNPEWEHYYVVIKHNNDFLGIGKVKNQVILNYVPKSRKIKEVFKETSVDENVIEE